MLIYILLLCFLGMLVGAYFLFKKEIMQPSIIFIAMYTLSVFCAVCNIENWGIHMSKMTFAILFSGAAEFLIVSYITQKIYEQKTKHKQVKPKMKKIEIPKVILYLIVIYCIAVIAIQLLVVFDVAARYEAFTGISRALTVFKEHTSYSKDISLPGYLTIMQCGVIAIGFGITLIFINNVLVEEENKLKYIKKNILNLAPAILFIISFLVQSNRGIIIDFVVSMVTIGILLWSQRYSWKKYIKIKTIFKMGIIAIIGLITFYYSAKLVGRINTKGMFDYITFYCGGSIECFNQYVNNDKQIKLVRGEETFYSLILNLDSIGLTNYELAEKESGHLEFVYYEEEMVGNIYTAYRRWINDFGILGAILLQAIMAVIFTVLYNRIKYNNGKQGNIWILIYGYLAYTIYMHPMDGYLYFEVLSKAGIARFALVIAFYIALENLDKILNIVNEKIAKYKEKEKTIEGKNKVLVFGITENPGGVESVIMNYYRHINREKIQFDFLCNTEQVAYEEEISKLGGKIYRITARSKDRKKYQEDMTNFFKEHAKEYNSIWVNVCSLANIDYLRYAKKYGIKKRIIHSHNSKNMDSFARGILHKINKIIVVEYATDFWACSEDAGKWFYYKWTRESKKYLIINNAIDAEKYKYNSKKREEQRKKLEIQDKFVIGNIGRLHFQKNQTFLLKIFKEICEKNTNSQLLIIGQGEEEEKLKKEAKELGIEEKVSFLGIISDIPEILQAMDAFVFPSLFEGLAVALIEAQASGLKVFASKDVMPEKAKMSEDFEFISLEKDEKEWAEIIMQKCKDKEDKREKRTNNVRKNGYDIKEEVKKIEQALL